ncbi:MAG: molybdopterin-dependent oxidoreductase [Magnetococcales bacterium]|nr:molybdopterin-dependent oxidoreductase [Magnetococcales bacterium]MBF0148497.1 molybdopterin-dependent oxidoreductase [Magnetococcales bacterium]MBF0173941.1 molybdopterin-dependent oxidoreductase [Magnetococcales bacterium]MBF0632567.1 molybdopterin-dependent oxidoreductase [Magnetococcales bacterium]
MSNIVSRRNFLKVAATTGLGVLMDPVDLFAQYRSLTPVVVENPLKAYPNRDWERLYRDIFKHDSTFVFMCCPNDTHNCLLNAYVKNDVVVRIEPTYGYGKATDLNGNQASHRWDPRCCQKGLVLARRFYGDRRVNGAYLRKGFKEWVDKGFPRDPKTGAAPKELMRRGWDTWVKVPHDVAHDYHARTLVNVATTYSGTEGAQRLLAQGYDPDMVEQVGGAGTRVMKHRGGMAKQGVLRIFGAFRFGNSMALLDAKVRGVSPEDAKGSGSWDSYTFHTDLPPGHPMVTGDQTNDFDLFDTENANVIVVWGMNWIATKMPDSHWLTEARLKGAKTVAVTVEYSATASKCDDVVVIRPGTDPAFALGVAQVMMANKMYNTEFVKNFTDLPTLVRMDTLDRLSAKDVFPNHVDQALGNWTAIIAKDQKAPPTPKQNGIQIPEKLQGDFAEFVMWDAAQKKPVAVSHNDLGTHFAKLGIDPALEGTFDITLADGKTVKARTVFDLTREYLDANLTPAQCSKITWAPESAITSLAETIAESQGRTLIACGMGPNQFWNNDNKDRAIFLILALAGSLGHHGGNIGSYAGNYKNTLFSGVPKWTLEDPFNPQTDPAGEVKVKPYLRPESMHYWANGERIMKAGNKKITTGAHTPTPTKVIWQVNSNSSLGNQKGFYDVVFNTLPKVELVVYNEWWWTGSCEFSDIVYGVDSWMEFKYPDLTGSNSNPFLQPYPVTPMRRTYQTVSDNETYLGVARALTKLTGEKRFEQLWQFIADKQPNIYLQRILDFSAPLKGYKMEEISRLGDQGIPCLMNTRTYPRINSYEQVNESKPWHTRTGRLEFYRPEIEFIEAGENMIVHREPSDATFHEPCAILATAHPALRPKTPADWGIPANQKDHITRQMRNTAMDGKTLLDSKHPLRDKGWDHVFHTPKYRHGAHTTPTDLDYMAVLFGPFGDMTRRDKRMPGVGEMYVDIHPDDARAMGIADGDYVWIDGDPNDLPFRGWQDAKRKEEYKVARLMARARYYPGTPKGVTRMWFNAYMAVPSTVKAHETRVDGLAKSAETNYQAYFRYGGHQSLTRSWLKPTHQTQTLISRKSWTNEVTKGMNVDVHCVTSAPRESIAKFSKAEDGGMNGKGLWRPVSLGLRPGSESETLKQYLKGGFVKVTKA